MEEKINLNKEENMGQLNFEIALKRLEGLVERLETGNETLENSLEIYEKATSLASFCYDELNSAKKRISKLEDIENHSMG